MIAQVILHPHENLQPAVIKWSEEDEDFIVDIPKDITLCDLVKLVDEIKRLTEY